MSNPTRAGADEIVSVLQRIGLIGQASLAMVADDELDAVLATFSWWNAAGPILHPAAHRVIGRQAETNVALIRAFAAWRAALVAAGLTGEMEAGE